MQGFCLKLIACPDSEGHVVALEAAARNIGIKFVVVVGDFRPDALCNVVREARAEKQQILLLAIQFVTTTADLAILEAAGQRAIKVGT